MVRLVTVPSRVLRDNRMGDPAERQVPVWLPPTYDASAARYPVVYFLAGFGGGGRFLLSESLWGETLPQRLDRLARDGARLPIGVRAD